MIYSNSNPSGSEDTVKLKHSLEQAVEEVYAEYRSQLGHRMTGTFREGGRVRMGAVFTD
jgi:hypothetical protein